MLNSSAGSLLEPFETSGSPSGLKVFYATEKKAATELLDENDHSSTK